MKRKPLETDNGMEAVMDKMLKETDLAEMPNGSMVAWWKHLDVH